MLLKRWPILGRKQRTYCVSGKVVGSLRYTGSYEYVFDLFSPQIFGLNPKDSLVGFVDYQYDLEKDRPVLNGPFNFSVNSYKYSFILKGNYAENRKTGLWECICKWNNHESVEVKMSYDDCERLTGPFILLRNHLKINATYQNGDLNGFCSVCDRLSKIKEKSCFEQGVLKGKYEYEDEEFSFTGMFNVQGQPEGYWKGVDKYKSYRFETLYKNGKIESSHYIRGRRIGEYIPEDKIASWWYKRQTLDLLPFYKDVFIKELVK